MQQITAPDYTIRQFKTYITEWADSCLPIIRNLNLDPVFYGDLYKLRRDKDTPNFIWTSSKIVDCLRRRQFDPLINKRTIGLVFGPSTTLYRTFLNHWTLNNKAMGTIWQALSKPPQRRQGPDLHLLWLLVGTPSATWPKLASRRADRGLPIRVSLIYLLPMLFVYRFLGPLRLVWLLEVYLQNSKF